MQTLKITGKVKLSLRAIHVTYVWMVQPRKRNFLKNGSCDLDLLSRSHIVEVIWAPDMVNMFHYLDDCSCAHLGAIALTRKFYWWPIFGCKSRSSGDLFFWHTRFCKDPPGEFTGKVKWSVRAINVTKVWMAPPQKSQFSKNGSCDLDLLSRSPIVELIRAPFMVNMLH